ncbi:ferredoxin [Kutzneria kofuensis]|uniref:Ferredoxin n=1 Tax=Kutzneria kofuensis TaxID=103725 RepID=A0A7W9KM51_9PSEU|nr:ferredoxin [Kutzneria kofuensis]MBB5895110.1 ferredoxin [Kutzneria kofuensis]
MRIRYDRERCVGSGACAFTLPDIFDQDEDDGRVLVLVERPGSERRKAVEDVAASCPVFALTVEDD